MNKDKHKHKTSNISYVDQGQSGGIINMMGTYQATLVAHSMNKLVYVAAKSYKLWGETSILLSAGYDPSLCDMLLEYFLWSMKIFILPSLTL